MFLELKLHLAVPPSRTAIPSWLQFGIDLRLRRTDLVFGSLVALGIVALATHSARPATMREQVAMTGDSRNAAGAWS